MGSYGARYVCAVCGKSIYYLAPRLCFYRRCAARMCSEDCLREHHNTVHIDRREMH